MLASHFGGSGSIPPRAAHVEFLMNKVTLEQDSLISLIFHTHLLLPLKNAPASILKVFYTSAAVRVENKDHY
jgi:hypothetical protein